MINKRDYVLSAFLFSVALLLRLYWVQTTGFNGLYGQDAYAYFDFAIELQQALLEWRLPTAFFWPLGYPSLLATLFSFFGASAAVGQVINLVLGSMLAVLVYILTRQLGCQRFGALVASLVMAVCGQAIQSSIVLMADTPALFWAMLSAVLLISYTSASSDSTQNHIANNTHDKFLSKLPSVRWLILSALMLTFAGVTRWLYFSLAPIWTIIVLRHWRWKIRWWDSIRTIGVVLLILLSQLAYNQTTPFPTFNHAWVVGWSPFNLFQQSFVNADGQFHYTYPNILFYAAPWLNSYYASPVFIVFVLAGLWALWRKRDPKLLFLGGWLLVPYLFLSGIPYQNIRFPLIVFPPVAILVGIGIHWLMGTVARIGLWRWVVFIGCILLSVFGFSQTLKTSETIISTFIANQQRDKEIATWVNEQLPTDATLYTFGITLILQHETPFTIYDLYFETPESLNTKWIEEQTDYVLVNGWVINNQWEGREPYIAFYWISDERGLLNIGRYGNYTLFQVQN
ncbi:MAG: phospholipid carrier-dependent glycosyltransferase [Anaerolineae bacterium]|nr:phospholipid carrier-dependent glycosyltransferase [Anaerolineae bacterium]